MRPVVPASKSSKRQEPEEPIPVPDMTSNEMLQLFGQWFVRRFSNYRVEDVSIHVHPFLQFYSNLRPSTNRKHFRAFVYI